MIILLALFYFLGGIATCLLPSKLFHKHKEELHQVLPFAAGWIGGFVLFSALLFAWVLQFDLSDAVFQYTALLLLGFFGLLFILPTFSWLFYTFYFFIKGLSFSEIVKGILLGLAWTPFSSWMLGASTAFSIHHSFYFAIAMALFYSLGVALMLILRAMGGDAIRWAEKGGSLRQVFGGILLIAAVFLAFAKTNPAIPGIQIENQAWMNQQLESLRPKKQPFFNMDQDPFSRSEAVQKVEASITPELYLGLQGKNSYLPGLQLASQTPAFYDNLDPLGNDQIGLKGEWIAYPDHLESLSDEAVLKINFKANRLYMVLGGENELPLAMDLDGQDLSSRIEISEQGGLFVKEKRLYNLINLAGHSERHVLSIKMPKGIKAYAFLFE